MPNANSVSSSSSNNQNMEMNQEFLRSISGGDRIYGRELYNRNRNSNQHTETNNEIDERINRINIDRIRSNHLNPIPICSRFNPAESSRRE